MLIETEWLRAVPLLTDSIEQIKRYREVNACSLAEATAKGFGREACEMFEEITGFKETNANAIFHHRLSLYGPPCHVCGKLLRTPQASYCAMCSAKRQHVSERQQ